MKLSNQFLIMVLETPVVGSLHIITGMYDKLELRLTKLSIHRIKRKTYSYNTIQQLCCCSNHILLFNLLMSVHRLQNLLSFLHAEIHGDCISEGLVWRKRTNQNHYSFKHPVPTRFNCLALIYFYLQWVLSPFIELNSTLKD